MAFESRLELTVDSRSGEKRLRSFEGQLERTEKAGEGLSRGMGMVGAAIGTLGAAVGGFTVSRVINEAAQFEDSMLGLQAVSGATASQMAALEDQARTLGATSAFSAQQAGQAQRFLAQAGFEVNEVLSATPGILDLATAGQMNLAQAADIASNVLGGMRMEVDELNVVNDVLAATAGGSNTSISQLGQALSTAAPLAASAGVSIEETAAAIGTLSDAGIQAERAGTGLRGIFRQLSKVTPQAREALAGYGLSLQDVNVEANGLGPVLETLREANISTADAFEIFGSEAGAAAQVLIHGADRVGEFSEELENSEGAAREMALTIGSGLSGSMRSFNSALSESILQMGDSGLSSTFQSVTDTASGLLSVYNGMLPEFVEANDLTREQGDNLETMAGALSAAAGAAGALGGAYITTTVATWGFHAAQVALNRAVRANPYVVAASSLVALTGALYGARNATVEFGETSVRVKDWLGALWIEAGNTLTSTMGSAIETTTGFFGSFGERVASIASGLWETFQALMGNIADIAAWAVNRSIGSFVSMGPAAAQVAEGVYNSFRTAFTSIGDFAAAIPEAVATMSTEPFERVAKDAAGAFVDNFTDTVSGVRDTVRDAMSTDYIGEGLEFAGEALSGFEERVSDTAFRLRFMNNETQEAASGVGNFGDSSKETEVDVDDLGKTVIATADGAKELTEAQKEAQRAADQWADSVRTLEDRLFPAEAAQRAFRQETILLQTALLEGAIGVDRYFEALQRLNTERSRDITGGFMEQVDTGEVQKNLRETKSVTEELGLSFSSAFEDAVVGGENFRDVLKGIAEDIQRLIIRRTITEPATEALGGIDFGGVIGSMFGGVGGGAGTFSGTTGGLYAEGGYTGDGGKYEPKGIVHGGEFVVKKSVVDNPGVRPMLERLNKGYANGGYVGPSSGATANPGVVVNVHTDGDAQVSQQESRRSDGTRQLDLYIERKVRGTVHGMFSSGEMDRPMRRFGARRQSTG